MGILLKLGSLEFMFDFESLYILLLIAYSSASFFNSDSFQNSHYSFLVS